MAVTSIAMSIYFILAHILPVEKLLYATLIFFISSVILLIIAMKSEGFENKDIILSAATVIIGGLLVTGVTKIFLDEGAFAEAINMGFVGTEVIAAIGIFLWKIIKNPSDSIIKDIVLFFILPIIAFKVISIIVVNSIEESSVTEQFTSYVKIGYYPAIINVLLVTIGCVLLGLALDRTNTSIENVKKIGLIISSLIITISSIFFVGRAISYKNTIESNMKNLDKALSSSYSSEELLNVKINPKVTWEPGEEFEFVTEVYYPFYFKKQLEAFDKMYLQLIEASKSYYNNTRGTSKNKKAEKANTSQVESSVKSIFQNYKTQLEMMFVPNKDLVLTMEIIITLIVYAGIAGCFLLKNE